MSYIKYKIPVFERFTIYVDLYLAGRIKSESLKAYRCSLIKFFEFNKIIFLAHHYYKKFLSFLCNKKNNYFCFSEDI